MIAPKKEQQNEDEVTRPSDPREVMLTQYGRITYARWLVEEGVRLQNKNDQTKIRPTNGGRLVLVRV